MTEEPKIINAVIEKVSLFVEDHRVLTAYLYLLHPNGNQGFGGWQLDGPENIDFCSLFIKEVLRIVGVREWEKLPGQCLRIKQTHTHISSIGNFLKDEWFDPKEEFLALEKKCQKNSN